MEDKITKQHQFNYPIDRVWKAISSATEISAWFIQADFRAEVGFEYTFVNDKTQITGEVLKANPVHELVYTWIVAGTGVVTTVSWKLEEQGSMTLLTLEHSGISNYPAESAVMMFENFEDGWKNCLDGLLKHLNENGQGK